MIWFNSKTLFSNQFTITLLISCKVFLQGMIKILIKECFCSITFLTLFYLIINKFLMKWGSLTCRFVDICHHRNLCRMVSGRRLLYNQVDIDNARSLGCMCCYGYTDRNDRYSQVRRSNSIQNKKSFITWLTR